MDPVRPVDALVESDLASQFDPACRQDQPSNRRFGAFMTFDELCGEIRRCTQCAPHLPEGPRPVLRARPEARVLVAGQAPGIRVHKTGIPFNDPSGDRLRNWMGVDGSIFYDESRVALIPMGFCYPGTGPNGDLPPRTECASAWRAPLLAHLPNITLTLAVGHYAISWHLGRAMKKNLTETVRHWQDYGPALIPLPHPSPRNNLWLSRNPWFEREVVPGLQKSVFQALDKPPPQTALPD